VLQVFNANCQTVSTRNVWGIAASTRHVNVCTSGDTSQRTVPCAWDPNTTIAVFAPSNVDPRSLDFAVPLSVATIRRVWRHTTVQSRVARFVMISEARMPDYSYQIANYRQSHIIRLIPPPASISTAKTMFLISNKIPPTALNETGWTSDYNCIAPLVNISLSIKLKMNNITIQMKKKKKIISTTNLYYLFVDYY